MLREFVASVYIFDGEKVLLLHHRKLDKWLPAGGHLQEGELPHECACREALEETGLEIQFQHQENVWVHASNAGSVPRPYLMLLEEIPPYGEKESHQHIDLVYVGYPIGGALIQNEESHALRWFSLEEIRLLTLEEEIFSETVQVLEQLFTSDILLINR